MYSSFEDKYTDLEKFNQWRPKIAAYREKLEENIPSEFRVPSSILPDDLDAPFNATIIPPKVMTKKELEITSLPASVLVKKIASGELTSTETFKSFAKRAVIAHQFTNCAMQFFIDEGLERARDLDDYFQRTGKTRGCLHGLPISLKEHYNYKNKVTTGAYVSLLDNVTSESAVTVQTFYDAGAVFYIRTTEPQSLMHLDSINLITGRGRNPYNLSLGPGGSSSGEGIIVAMGGCSMGVGTDIGGSIRAPAGFCGCWALRPTQKRISMKNCLAAISGFEGVVCVMGPIVRFAEDLDFWMKSAISLKPWNFDSNVIPLPWREVSVPDPLKLKIAVWFDDGIVRPHPPIIRGLKYIEKKLKDAGINVVRFKAHRVEEAINTANILFSSDSNKGQLSLLSKSGEPLTALTKWAMGFGKGTGSVTAEEYRDLTAIRDSIREDYKDIMDSEKIDFIISPIYNGVAPKPSTLHYWGYTALWNLIDMPNVVFPTGLYQDPEIDVKDTSFKPRSDIEAYELRLYDDPQIFKGAPISLQITGRRYHDEEVVKFAELVDSLI